jgi:Fe-S oxidoreductase
MSGATSAAQATTTEGCRYCWMCRHACPVGHVTARETYTPHGWALMIESVARGQISWTREAADVMYACADCGLCQAHCVTDQPLPVAINRSREAIAAAGGAPPAVYELDRQLRAHGSAYGSARPVASTAKGAVALFVGDAAFHLEPKAVEAAQALLEAAGLSPVVIGAGRASGLLANTVGLRAAAQGLAADVVAEVQASGASEVLVLGPADKWTFTEVFGNRLEVVWPVAVAVREVVDVLAEALAAGRLKLRSQPVASYAYHDPCHAPRLGRTRPAPRALLSAALGASGARDLLFREHRAHPCGAIGGLEFTHPDIADKLADARLRPAFTNSPAARHR